MPVNFSCACGQPLVTAVHFAGLSVPCPRCGEQAVVPEPGTAPTNPQPWAHGTAVAVKPRVRGTDDPDNPFGFVDPAANARERERQAREGPPQAGGGSLEGSLLNAGVLGGMLAMIIAVVWFVVGLAGDVIFFYPPILFVIGLVAFGKGLMQGPGPRE